MTADWHELRRGVFTASEAAALCGISKYVTPWQLYQRKAGLLPPVEESEPMTWGTLLEGVVFARLRALCPDAAFWRGVEVPADQMPRAAGVEVIETDRGPFHLHRGSWLGCTVDGVGRLLAPEASTFGIEVKTVSKRTHDTWAERYTDPPLPGLPGATRELPDDYALQAQQQMHLTGLPWTLFPVLVGGQRLECVRVDRDETIGAAVAQLATDAAQALAEGREPPLDPYRDAEALGYVVARRGGLTETVEAAEDVAAMLHEAAALMSVGKRLIGRAKALSAEALQRCSAEGIQRLTSPLVTASVVTRAETPERVVVQRARPAHSYLRISARKGALEQLLAGFQMPALTGPEAHDNGDDDA